MSTLQCRLLQSGSARVVARVRRSLPRALGALALSGALASASAALAEEPRDRQHEPMHGAQSSHDAHRGDAPESGHGGHGDDHHQEFNWYHGLIGEKAGVEPNLLWRAPGTPAPFAAQLLNTFILAVLLFKFARAPIARALVDRRNRIMKGMDDAAAMKREAEKQLSFYKERLANLDAEIERVRREMRESAETERVRILSDARARRARLEQEARVLVEQEMKAVREQLTRETALAALRSARELLRSATSTEDHRRLCEQYLDGLRQQRPAAGARSTTT